MTIFTPDQERQIQRFLDIIRENGGYGVVKLEVKKGEIKFISLETSAIMDERKEVATR